MSDGASRPWWAISFFNGLIIVLALILILIMALGDLTGPGQHVVAITMLVIALVCLPATVIMTIRTHAWTTRNGLKRR